VRINITADTFAAEVDNASLPQSMCEGVFVQNSLRLRERERERERIGQKEKERVEERERESLQGPGDEICYCLG
jgi:hypothetical protein